MLRSVRSTHSNRPRFRVLSVSANWCHSHDENSAFVHHRRAIRSFSITGAVAYEVHNSTFMHRRSIRSFATAEAAVAHEEDESQDSIFPFLLADIGEGIREVELLEWFAKPGETVKQFDKIALVQSDKATVEITSRYDGSISELCGQVGDMIQVGEPLLYMAGSHVDGQGPNIHSTIEPMRVKSPSQSPIEIPKATTEPELAEAGTGKPVGNPGGVVSKTLTSPAVRKLAMDNDIDLSTIKGTGPKGRILKQDLLGLVEVITHEGNKVSQSSVSELAVGETHVLKGMSRFMAKSMTEALGVPQMGIGDDIVLDNLLECKRKLQESNAHGAGTKISLLALLIKATSMSLHAHPIVNSRIKGTITKDFEVQLLPHHDLGLAMDTDRGLVVPVIQKVETLSIMQVQEEIDRLKEDASNKGISEKDMVTPSFTLSNIGSLGVGTSLQPVLGPPMMAMGATGRIQTLPRFDKEGKVVPMSIMHVSWVGDHRVLDGATLARFHRTFAEYVSNPVTMLASLS